jgi:hypothetical protein
VSARSSSERQNDWPVGATPTWLCGVRGFNGAFFPIVDGHCLALLIGNLVSSGAGLREAPLVVVGR